MKQTPVLFIAVILLSATLAADRAANVIPLIPKPAHADALRGTLRLSGEPAKELRGVCADTVVALDAWLKKAEPPGAAAGRPPAHLPLAIRVNQADAALKDEGYHLRVSPGEIHIDARQPAGAFYALQTLCQMLPDDPAHPGAASPARIALAAVDIVDAPRFAWRGMHLDVSRHFFTKSEIEQCLDLLARFKLNVFHWHLVDDGGWRIEIKRYPKLTEVGAWRRPMSETWSQEKLDFPGPGTSEPLYGGFYTQDDVREIVAYAAARHITVVPEIEMPGHSLAALFAYPELKCDNLPARGNRAYETTAMCPGKEATFTFLEGVLDEVMALFPSTYIHIGGDEVDRSVWAKCPHCQQRMRDEGFHDTAELQSYTIRRVERFLNGRGRTLVGWDEILEGGLAPNAVVMSWRGVSGGIAAARTGHPVVMTPTSHCYFDYAYDNISTEGVYGYDPVPSALSADEGRLVLGSQANVWTEWMPDFARVQTMILPRMLALAEVLWSPREGRSFAEFERRLGAYYPRFDRLDLSYYFAAPQPAVSVIAFDGRATVALPVSNVPGVALRYTTDGTDPGPRSTEYRRPIVLKKSAEIRAGWFGSKGRMGDMASVRAVRRASTVTAGVPGLSFRQFNVRVDKMPDFGSLGEDASGVQAVPAIEPLDPRRPFVVEWRGLITIDRDGLYTFTVGSDDGSLLWIYDTPVVRNDGLHGYIERSGAAWLTRGTHPIRIGYFNAMGDRGFKAWIEGPGLARQSLAGAMLTHQ